jgi:hypothetical protein
MHVDDWLDAATPRVPPGEEYARWWLEIFRFPAWKKMLYAEIMAPFKLFCTYKGERFRCIGCSRMGDVWLTRNPDKQYGYDLRIDVLDCSNWSSTL